MFFQSDFRVRFSMRYIVYFGFPIEHFKFIHLLFSVNE